MRGFYYKKFKIKISLKYLKNCQNEKIVIFITLRIKIVVKTVDKRV